MANTKAIINRLGGRCSDSPLAADMSDRAYSQSAENTVASDEEAEQACADLTPALLASMQAAAMPKKKITK
ncbi:MAG: hypothetical protein JJT82_03895 [Legionellaceae bacterium]|nr:hypothetical protein [Legionellaceae bacterium]